MTSTITTRAAGAETSPPFGPIHQIDAGLLNVGYAEAGPADGPAVLLLHGWPYDIHSYAEVAPLLAAESYRVIVPYLRGCGKGRAAALRPMPSRPEAPLERGRQRRTRFADFRRRRSSVRQNRRPRSGGKDGKVVENRGGNGAQTFRVFQAAKPPQQAKSLCHPLPSAASNVTW